MLAYHLLISIEHQLQQQGDKRRWSTIEAVLSTHQRTTVIWNDEQEQIHSIRLSGSSETAHREIYTRLNGFLASQMKVGLETQLFRKNYWI